MVERAEVATAKTINPEQLKAELNGADVFTSPGIVQADCTQSDLEAAVAAHVADPSFGVPPEDRDLSAVRTKALAVFNGTDTFTAAQIQKIVAGLVLKATRS